jgi:hypothetical protein
LGSERNVPEMNRTVGGNRRKSSQGEEGHQLLLAADQTSQLSANTFPRFLGKRFHTHTKYR